MQKKSNIANSGQPRIGFGYDIHQLVEGRTLVLGGVKIPSPKGLLGHSDADVLLHAICDALLGAAALGDIGIHFPNTNVKYKNISSLRLLEEVKKLLHEHNYSIQNIDSTIILQAPKITKYVPSMRKKIAVVLKIRKERISIKATTNEQIGALGRREGCAAFATALLITQNEIDS